MERKRNQVENWGLSLCKDSPMIGVHTLIIKHTTRNPQFNIDIRNAVTTEGIQDWPGPILEVSQYLGMVVSTAARPLFALPLDFPR